MFDPIIEWWNSVTRFFRNLRQIPQIMARLDYLQEENLKLRKWVIKTEQTLDGYDLPVLIKKMDELDWKQFAVLKVLVSNALLNPKHCAGILSIVDQPTYVVWSAEHAESIPVEVRKYFTDLLTKDHKEPG